METNNDILNKRKLNEYMNQKGFWSFDFYSLVPLNNGETRKYGNFEFLTIIKNSYLQLSVRYLGKDSNFFWINQIYNGHNYYSSCGEHILYDKNSWCVLFKTWQTDLTKQQTYRSTTIIRYLEEAKRIRENVKWNKKYNFKQEKEIKLFNKNVKEHKLEWQKHREEAVKTLFNVSFDDYIKEQDSIKNAKQTNFIVKVAPKLIRLKDECELMLKKLSDPEGPSEQARKDFYNAYKEFQYKYDDKSYLTNLRYFKKAKQKGNK